MLVKNKDKHKLCDNDKGFTLVELLISIAILALIVVPIFNSLTMSASMNLRAKQKHKATIVAENLLEQIKSMNLVKIDTWGLIKENLSTSDVKQYRLKPYTYQGTEYNVEIKLDPTTPYYKNGVDKKLINDYSFPKISEVYGNSNAIISQSKEDDTAARMFVEYNQAAYDADADANHNNYELFYSVRDDLQYKEKAMVEVKKIMSKNMQIVILPTSTPNHVLVECTYVYTCKSTKLPAENQTVELTLYSKDITDLNSIYFFYDPLELNYSDTDHQDNLYVNNKAREVANVYIIRRGETVAPTSYFLDAIYYAPPGGVQVRGIIDHKNNLTFYSNLSQGQLGTVDLHTGMDTNTLVPKSGVIENRIYDVKVSIYPKDDWTEPIVEFTTTKEEW